MTENEKNLTYIMQMYDMLKNGNLECMTQDAIQYLNSMAMYEYNLPNLTDTDIRILDYIIKICNLLYNNTPLQMLPIEDGVYDLILEKLKVYMPNYTVGSIPVEFKSVKLDTIGENSDGNVSPFIKFKDTNKMMFEQCLTTHSQVIPGINNLGTNNQVISKRMRTVSHKYPELVGTLDKVKFVLDMDAKNKGVYNNSNVKIFERDFLWKHVANHITNEYDIEVIAELKYDGVSIEAEIEGDHIVSARTRGDTGLDMATDLTPILAGYQFPMANPNTAPFGMKFEACISKYNMQMIKQEFGKVYANPRNAVIGILGNGNARELAKYITLVPLATSIPNIDRVEEIEFMNRYYNTGEPLRYNPIRGNYTSVLFLVSNFVKDAFALRSALPFLYDGVVVSYRDMNIRKKLGRVNSVNKYSIAIKFDANVKYTRIRGISYTIGSNGNITPMAHYDAVEFYGGINTKSSLHSYDRFKKLNLRPGDIIQTEYVNDVIVHVTKPDNIFENLKNPNPPFEFIKCCPECGSPITISDSGKNATCSNLSCPGRTISRITNMLVKIGYFKGFSEESVIALGIKSLSDVLNIDPNFVIQQLGEANGTKFINSVQKLKSEPIPDYVMMGSLGISGVSTTKWKTILNKVHLTDLLKMNSSAFSFMLNNIKGISSKTSDIILKEIGYYANDINTMLNTLHIVDTYNSNNCFTGSAKIRFSGVRDDELEQRLRGTYNISSTQSVTKDTDYLLVPYEGYTSTKVQKALEYNSKGANIAIVPIQKFKDNISTYLRSIPHVE